MVFKEKKTYTAKSTLWKQRNNDADTKIFSRIPKQCTKYAVRQFYQKQIIIYLGYPLLSNVHVYNGNVALVCWIISQSDRKRDPKMQTSVSFAVLGFHACFSDAAIHYQRPKRGLLACFGLRAYMQHSEHAHMSSEYCFVCEGAMSHTK